MEELLRRDALEYHRVPTSGKISVTPTKSLVNQRDLALAYSPGVAYACLAIRDDPKEAATLTSRANLVAVITNGSAVLGLGNIGALAGKSDRSEKCHSGLMHRSRHRRRSITSSAQPAGRQKPPTTHQSR